MCSWVYLSISIRNELTRDFYPAFIALCHLFAESERISPALTWLWVPNCPFLGVLYIRVWAISSQSRRLAVFLIGNISASVLSPSHLDWTNLLFRRFSVHALSALGSISTVESVSQVYGDRRHYVPLAYTFLKGGPRTQSPQDVSPTREEGVSSQSLSYLLSFCTADSVCSISWPSPCHLIKHVCSCHGPLCLLWYSILPRFETEPVNCCILPRRHILLRGCRRLVY